MMRRVQGEQGTSQAPADYGLRVRLASPQGPLVQGLQYGIQA